MVSRALITDSEREALKNPEEHGHDYRGTVKKRLEDRIERLPDDLEILRETDPELFNEIISSFDE